MAIQKESVLEFTLKRVCGHCGNRAPMIIAAKYSDNKIEYDSANNVVWNHGECYHLLKCQSCDKVELRNHYYHDGVDEIEVPTKFKTLYPAAITIPVGLPKKIQKEYEEALISRYGSPNAYGVLLGRVLETVCNDKKAKGDTIGKQLTDLANKNQLPPEIISYSRKLNRLRVFGAHYNVGKLTAAEIPIMENLTRVILEYVYSAPYIMKQAEKAISKVDGKRKTTLRGVTATPLNKTKVAVPIRRIIVEDVPRGDFEEIRIEMPFWEHDFLKLVIHKKLIKYEVYHMPTISTAIRQALGINEYRDLILKDDNDQHFLVPKSYDLAKHSPH